jgi:hypothetical protein
VVLHPVGSVGHIMHSGVFGPQNIDALFVVLQWEWYRFYRKRLDTVCRPCVLHPVGSVAHVAHYGASGA